MASLVIDHNPLLGKSQRGALVSFRLSSTFFRVRAARDRVGRERRSRGNRSGRMDEPVSKSVQGGEPNPAIRQIHAFSNASHGGECDSAASAGPPGTLNKIANFGRLPTLCRGLCFCPLARCRREGVVLERGSAARLTWAAVDGLSLKPSSLPHRRPRSRSADAVRRAPLAGRACAR